MKNRKIRILVLGDAQVGKTSWITSLVSDNQPDKIPPVIDPVVFTEMFVHTFQVSTVLIDSSSNILSQTEVFQDEVKSAQVILLLYDLTNSQSVESLKNLWMPRIEKENQNVPVIIIGNKRDILEEIQNSDKIPEENRIEKVIVPLIKNFKQVQMGFECSALLSQYISDVIYGAHVAVLFPLSPLYDISQKAITLKFEKALARIFRICDKDNDLKWSDEELRDFQLEVFQGELTISDIQGIKQLIRDEEVINQDRRPLDRSNSMAQEVTYEGFKILQKKCVELMKMQICWAILRHFGYDDRLDLDKKLFKDQLLVNVEQGQTAELSGKANQFLLQQCFRRFSCEKQISNAADGTEIVLNKNDLQTVFFPYSKESDANSHPFSNIMHVLGNNDREFIYQEEWMSLWAYKTRENYLEAYKLLVYLGYQGSLDESFLITNSTNCYSQLLKMPSRHVYSICIIGIQDTQAEMQRIIQSYQRKNERQAVQVTKFFDLATQVRLENGRKKTLLLTFVHSFYLSELLAQPAENQEDKQGSSIKKFDQMGIVYRDSVELQQFLEENSAVEEFFACPKFLIQFKQGQEDPQNANKLKEFTNQRLVFQGLDTFNEDKINLAILNLIENPTKGLHKNYIENLKEQDGFFRKHFGLLMISCGITGVLGIITWANRRSLASFFDQIKSSLIKK